MLKLERGSIIQYDSAAHTADVRVYGSHLTTLEDVPVSEVIGPELVDAGDYCLVALSAESDVAVVLAIFGDAPGGWVTGALVKDGEIDTADLADGAVTSAKIEDGTIVMGDLAMTPLLESDFGSYGSIPAGDGPYGSFAMVDASGAADGEVLQHDSLEATHLKWDKVQTAGIEDGAVTAAKVAADVCTQAELDAHAADEDAHHEPAAGYPANVTMKTQTSSQTLTTTWTTYSGLSQSISVGGGETWRVAIVATVEFDAPSGTSTNYSGARVYQGSTGLGRPHYTSHATTSDRCSVTVVGHAEITSTTTFYVKVEKLYSYNTQRAIEGSMVIIYWRVS